MINKFIFYLKDKVMRLYYGKKVYYLLKSQGKLKNASS